MISTKKFSSFERPLIFAAIAILLVILIMIFAGSLSASDSSYEIVSPTVYQGQELSGTDFLEPKSFLFGCRAVTEVAPSTAETGNHSVVLHIEGNGGYSRSIDCTYTVLPMFRSHITIEAGTPMIFIDDILSPGVPDEVVDALLPQITGSLPGDRTLGKFDLGVTIGGINTSVPVTIVDTTPPTATPVTVVITDENNLPSADDFVTGIIDATEVSCSFGGEYTYTEPAVFDVDIVLTDKAGNKEIVTATADCRIDHEPPTISWIGEALYVELGGTVSYRGDVTAADNSGGEVTLDVSTDGIDLHTLGEYLVVYTATDSSGNTATAERKLYVVAKLPPEESVVLATATEIYDRHIVTRDNMSKWDIAYAIFRWTHDSITYVGTGIDKSSWLQAAHDGFDIRSGDCFTYMSVARALLTVADIPCMVVERDRHEGETRHYWLLVDIGDGWYHFDACQRSRLPSFVLFMRTDDELQWYTDNYSEHYYRFDHDAYPERAENSYYDTILQSPGELHP